MQYFRKHKPIISFCVSALLLLLVSVSSDAQVIPGGDTSAFRVNSSAGWAKVSSYQARDTSGTIILELTLQRSIVADNWAVEQRIGNITDQRYVPAGEAKVDYYLLRDSHWIVRIAKSGEVFLSLKEGGAPVESPLFLPIKVRYSAVSPSGQ